MKYKNIRQKDRAVIERYNELLREGMTPATAKCKVAEEFNYVSTAAIYYIFKRNNVICQLTLAN